LNFELTMLTLTDVLTGLTGVSPKTIQKQPITNVAIDSRKAAPGSLFVALPGENVDGHDFVAAAFEAGAVAAIVDRAVDADCLTIDADSPQFPTDWRAPICIKIGNSLLGLQKLAAYWRRKFSPQIIGITGSVGKPAPKSWPTLFFHKSIKRSKIGAT